MDPISIFQDQGRAAVLEAAGADPSLWTRQAQQIGPGVYRGYIGLGFRCYTGIMEKKMETTTCGI